jgi:hypothetical protein
MEAAEAAKPKRLNRVAPNPVTTRQATAAEKRAATKAAKPTVKAAEFTRLVEKSAKKVEKKNPAEAAAKDAILMLKLSKVEHAAVQRWSSNGRRGPKPATPNLDKVQAEHAKGIRMVDKVKAARKAGSNGGGRRTASGLTSITDDELHEWMKKYLTANPSASRPQTRKAFTEAGFAASPSRFRPAFANLGGKVGTKAPAKGMSKTQEATAAKLGVTTVTKAKKVGTKAPATKAAARDAKGLPPIVAKKAATKPAAKKVAATK